MILWNKIHFRKLFWLLLPTLFFSSCTRKGTFISPAATHWAIKIDSAKEKPLHSFYLLGGATNKNIDGLKIMAKVVEAIKENNSNNQSILLVGDNGVQKGFAPKEEKKHTQSTYFWKSRLALLSKLKNTQSYILLGDKEWAEGGRKGLERVLALDNYISENSDGISLLPKNACPDPVEIAVSNDITLVVLNTQWWLHPWKKMNDQQVCEVKNEADFLIQLKDILNRNKYKQVIVAGHHPLESSGKYGGAFPLETHLFPFTEYNSTMYLPLPVLGSLYVLYRKSLGDTQDLTNSKYRLMRNALQKTLEAYPGIIYVSGHENIAEFSEMNNFYHIISGSLEKNKGLKRNENLFQSTKKGFVKVDIYKNKKGCFSYIDIEGNTVFKKVFPLKYQENKLSNRLEGYLIKKNKSAAKPSLIKFKKSKRNRNYTNLWNKSIPNVPLLDFETTKGGLEVEKRIGGHTVRSLLLKNRQGEHYKLYTLERFPQDATPPELKGLFNPQTGISDITAYYPFAPLVVSKLTKNLDLYSPNPELFYVLPSTHLGSHLGDFSNRLCWLEKVHLTDVDFKDMWELVHHDEEHSINEVSLLRYRLLDFLVANWNRSEANVKWNSTTDFMGFTHFEPRIYANDFAFFKTESLFNDLRSRKWGMPWLQGFTQHTRNPAAFFYKTRHLDRTLLSSLDFKTWEKEIELIQRKLTDEVIENAFHFSEDSIYKNTNDELIKILKNRRDNLLKSAREWYSVMVNKVEVLGSNTSEIFEVESLPAGEFTVSIYKSDKKGEKDVLVYKRLFSEDETNEVNLYGFDGDDRFLLGGNEKLKTSFRIIGGKGNDSIEGFLNNKKSNIKAYDTPSGLTIKERSKITNKSNEKWKGINNWSRTNYEFNLVKPILFSGFNPDDGILLGGGASFTVHGFRKKPYSQHHLLEANFAPKTNSFHFVYEGTFKNVFRNWDVLLHTKLNEPGFTRFFYGFGNNTISNERKRTEDLQHYRTRFSEWVFQTSLKWNSSNNPHSLESGFRYRAVKVSERFNVSENRRFILDYAEQDPFNEVLPLLNKRRHFLSLFSRYIFDTKDDKILPEQGVRFSIEGNITQHLDQGILNFKQLKSSFSFFTSFGKSLKTTLAMRIGGAVNTGDFEFYQANVLGGLNNLRGYRQYRFTGDKSIYQNTELRTRLFNFRTPIIAGTFGMLLLHDVGKVWSNQPTNLKAFESKDDLNTYAIENAWHRGYGTGVWVSILPNTVVSFDYTLSNSIEKSWYIRLGFMY